MSATHEAKLYFDKDMEESDRLSFAGGQAIVYTSRCPHKAGSNEDAAGLISLGNGSGVVVVADGMGGGAAGEEASRLAVCTLRTALKDADETALPLRSAILNGIERANHAVVDLGIGAATTLAAVEIQSGRVRPYHVGDSMILIVGQRGKIKLRTISHSPVGYAVESGLMDQDEAMHHEDRHLVSNMIGHTNMRIEVGSTLQLAPRDTLVMASDGLFDNLHEEEIIERIRKGSLAAGVCQLATEAQHRMNHPVSRKPSKLDDLTLVAFRPGQTGTS